jgi:hypothetical protein
LNQVKTGTWIPGGKALGVSFNNDPIGIKCAELNGWGMWVEAGSREVYEEDMIRKHNHSPLKPVMQ